MFRLLVVALVVGLVPGLAGAQCPDGCCPCVPASRQAPAWGQAPAYSQAPTYFQAPAYSQVFASPPQVVYYHSPFPVVHEVYLPAVSEVRGYDFDRGYRPSRQAGAYEVPAYGGYDQARFGVQAGVYGQAGGQRYRQVTRTRTR